MVAASITLDRLHDAIQIIMGWPDSHLHEFTIGKSDIPNIRNQKKMGLCAADSSSGI